MAAQYKPLGQALEEIENEENSKGFKYQEVQNEKGRTSSGLQERVALFLRGGTRARTVYNNIQITVSVAACILYIVETYHEGKLGIRFLIPEVIVSVILLVDYVLQVIAAEIKLGFILSFSGIVDLLSIAPILVIFFDLPASFGFVRFLRVFRVVRALRLHRLLRAQVSAVRHQIMTLIFTTVSLIFCAAGVMHAISVVDPAAFVDNHVGGESPDSMSFFTAVYFVIVSIATVGYGDIVPVQLASRAATALTILLAFILLPKQINQLFRVMETWSKYMGTVDLSKDERHVVVACAALTVDNIQMFLHEFFHKDHAPRNASTKVVLVDPDPPSAALMALMEDAAYYRRVAFLQGSLMEDRTLERLRLETCRGVFVVANKLAGDPLADDQRAMLRGLALIKYLQMHHTRVFTAVQLHHPDLMPRVLAAGIDHCTSLTHLTAALLAQSCLVPGFATLALNLVASYSGQVSVDLYDDVDADHWLDEYYYGTSHELYEVLLGDTAVGWSFPALAAHVYATHGICVVGMETAAPSGQGFIIALSPGPSYTVRRGDRALCLARCEADAQHVAWLPSNPSAVSVQHDAIALETLEASRSDSGPGGACGWEAAARGRLTLLMKMLEDDRVSVDADAVRGALDDVIAMIPATAPALRPIGVIGGDVPALSGHIVLLGDVALAPYFMPALRHRHRPGQGQGQSGPAMVAMHPDSKLIKRTSDALAQWTGAYAVVGSPRVREDLLDRAQLASAGVVLILANARDAGAELLDYNALVSHMEVKAALVYAANTAARVIVSVLSDDNLKFYDMLDMGSGSTPRDVVFSPVYASGAVFLASHLDALLPQTFFNPSMPRTILALAEVGAVTLVDTPAHWVDRSYSDVALAILSHGAVCMGLYRPASFKQASAPYVATNPRPQTRIVHGDMLYIVGDYNGFITP